MVQGIGKEFVFPDDNCKGYYLKCLQKHKDKYPAKILAFCVMGNHAHVLAAVKDSDELAKYFKRVNADYAMYYNRTRKRVGYVFRDRFKSEIITTEKYLMYCLAYIQNNPVNAGTVKKAEEYKYSSYVNYLRGVGIVDFDEAANHFDTGPENIKAVMSERSEAVWMEHDDKDYEDKYEVLKELIARYNISSSRSVKNEDLAKKMAQEIKERSGASLREIALMLEIGRETLRKWLSIPPSP